MFNDEPASAPLTGKTSGIESFRVEGEIDGIHAHAEWDGRWVIATHALLVRAELVLAVDEVFTETRAAQAAEFQGRPERLLRAMLVICDSVAVAEFTHRGRRRMILR